MSEPSETSGRPLTPTTKQEQQPEGNTINPTSSSSRTKHRKSSQPSDDHSELSKSTNSRRRPGTASKTPSGPHAGSSRSEQRSTNSPTKMMSQAPSIHYTRTGRISKAKKGLKVHNCECGRVCYTRSYLLAWSSAEGGWLSTPLCHRSHVQLVVVRPHVVAQASAWPEVLTSNSHIREQSTWGELAPADTFTTYVLMCYRRHQKNHAQEDALVCEYPDCGKTFYRVDLLHRHQERQWV